MSSQPNSNEQSEDRKTYLQTSIAVMEKTLAIVCIVILSTTGILMLAGNVHVVIVKKGAVQLPSVSNQYTPVRKMRESVPNLTEEELVSIAVKSVSKANLVHQIDL